MTRPAVTVRPDTPLGEVLRVMIDRRISGIPVVDEAGSPVGMVTEGDLLRRAELGTEKHRPRWLEFLAGPGRSASDYVHLHGRRTQDVMTDSVVTVQEDAPLSEIVRLMEAHHVKRMPVVRGGAVAGVVSRADIIRALARAMPGLAEAPQNDEVVGKRVDAALQTATWTASRNVTARVEDGIAHLDGIIFDERERQAWHVLVRNVPGVRGVEDHIVWVEPNTGMAFPAA